MTVQEILPLINTIPRIGNRISWSDHPHTIARIVQAILKSSDQTRFIKEICAKSKTNWQVFRKFCLGQNSSGTEWTELRKILTDLNCTWNTINNNRRSRNNKVNTVIAEPEIPHTPLAVVSGAVIPIKPIPPAPAIVAKSGEFAKSNAKTIRKTSTDTDGNFVITTISTRTVLMGTDEYKALVIKAFNKNSDSVAVG